MKPFMVPFYVRERIWRFWHYNNWIVMVRLRVTTVQLVWYNWRLSMQALKTARVQLKVLGLHRRVVGIMFPGLDAAGLLGHEQSWIKPTEPTLTRVVMIGGGGGGGGGIEGCGGGSGIEGRGGGSAKSGE